MEKFLVYQTKRIGRLLLTEEDGALTRIDFIKDADDAPCGGQPNRFLRSVARQLDEYFEGARREFEVPLKLKGTEFQLRVWSVLQTIPYGATASYGEVARAAGSPKGARAVGMANHVNPVAIIVPCHRVIGADGKLVGFGGGLDKKRYLLDMEAWNLKHYERF